MITDYKDVSIEGDCGTFTLKYTPLCKGGKPQTVRLEASAESDDEDDKTKDVEAAARFEAASILECKVSDLPPTEWL